MKYAIVYASRTGNTKQLAEAVRETLPTNACVYFGEPGEAALTADRLYVGFWTDKGTCDAVIQAFLHQLRGKEIFLFGTAGFGGDFSYFQGILDRVSIHVNESNRLIGTYMCQGKMPMTVRARYEKMLSAPETASNAGNLIENFDKALSHPNEEDLEKLKATIRSLC